VPIHTLQRWLKHPLFETPSSLVILHLTQSTDLSDTSRTMQESTFVIAGQGQKSEDGGEGMDGKGKDERQDDGPTISSSYNHADSDITLISSDHVHFKVHTSILRRVS
jgi:hypothetical protein